MFTFLCLNLKTFSQNDVCASATALSTGTTAGTITSSFTNYTSDPIPSCESLANKCSWSGWYAYTTGASGGSLTVSLAPGTLKYGSLTLYSGSCGSLTELSCSDPNVSAAAPSITVTCLTASTTYYLMVWCDGTPGSNTYYGTYNLTASFTSTANDCVCNASSVIMGAAAIVGSYTGTATGNNTTATADGSVYCFTTNKNQWYSFTAPVDGSYYCGITPGTMTDPEIAVYKGSCNALTLSNCAGYDGTNIKDANHATVYTSSGTYTLAYSPFSLYSSNYTYGGVCNLMTGQTAYVMVDNYSGGSSGTYTLTVANLKNDDIANPLIINSCGSAFQGTTIGATNCGNGIGDGMQNNVDGNNATACDGSSTSTSCGTSGGPGSACYNGGTNQTHANNNGGDIGYSIENDSWYEFCVTSTCTVTITFGVNSASCLVPSSAASTALQFSAFSGTSGSLTKIYGGYCLENITTTASFSFAATANSCYFFEVDGYSGANCDYTIQADIIPTCVLSVKLSNFNATNEQGKIKLEWTSIEETNADKYVVERSEDGIEYTPIITQKAKGNSTSRTSYTVYDESPIVNKINYYKLNEYDKNGKGGLISQTFITNTVGFPQFNVYPNPTTGKVHINIYGFGVPSVMLEIIDVYGKSIWNNNVELENGSNLQEVDLSAFEPGFYIVRTTDGSTFYKKTLILTR